ncbi:MAG: DUF3159 domain-containing protein [Anaerolineae bacterium]|nr:DUF3159 domain-containing protein [Anaerolineae bacterium]
MMDKFRQVADEFRTVVAGRGNLLDALIPPVLFLLLNALLGFQYAMWGSLGLALLLMALRLARRQSLLYALSGVGAVALAILLTLLLDRAEGYFLPNIITGGLIALACLVSILVRRPLVAWSSVVARRWPLAWYWHPRVRPAYSEVTGLWVAYFSARLLLQAILFQRGATGSLAVVQFVMGWPATVLLLVISYLYGTWRLRTLGGPSVEEFKAGAEPPWHGQQKGF